MLVEFRVEGYRSLKDIWLRMRRVNVIVGANGSGKSNLYKSLYLAAAAAEGRFSRTLAEEGGMPSVLWAGDRGKGPVRMKLALKLEKIKYEMACGLPQPGFSPFPLDPEIKEEKVSILERDEKVMLLNRTGPSIVARDPAGKKARYAQPVPECESVLSELREPQQYPLLAELRQELLSWRFYHRFRTDEQSPLREPQVATRTMCLSHDATDLASALATIQWSGDAEGLALAIEEAFPGAQLSLPERDGRLSVALHMPGFQRPFDARELSDGTLHYLCLLAALLTPRPPGLLALNEPEASIHPDLLGPLARLIGSAARHCQLWITTHSAKLAGDIEELTGASPIELEKVEGATHIKGQKLSPE